MVAVVKEGVIGDGKKKWKEEKNSVPGGSAETIDKGWLNGILDDES